MNVQVSSMHRYIYDFSAYLYVYTYLFCYYLLPVICTDLSSNVWAGSCVTILG